MGEHSNVNFIGSLFEILRMVRVATLKTKTSTDQTVATICQEALRGAAAHYAAVRSTVKIDDLLALHLAVRQHQKRFQILKKRWVRKLHRIEALIYVAPEICKVAYG